MCFENPALVKGGNAVFRPGFNLQFVLTSCLSSQIYGRLSRPKFPRHIKLKKKKSLEELTKVIKF